MTLDEMDASRQANGYTYRQIAEKSGVALGTVQKIFGGTTSSPRYDTMQKLEQFFVAEASVYRERTYNDKSVMAKYSRRDLPRQGTYTIEDYLAWPEDDRIELIDGVIYDMAGPMQPHQVFLVDFASRVHEQIRKNKGTCVTFVAPSDVQIDCDDKTVVQPDFFIVCDRSKIENKKRIYGAPDFVVEVLSPSTRMKDMFIKQNKYMTAGVKEYWIVDLKERLVTVYLFEDSRICQYGFDQVIPIGIYDGKISVDFAEITEYMESVFGEDIS